MKQSRFDLSQHEMPTHFVNILPTLKKYLGIVPDPPLHPGTMQPVKVDDLATIFPKAIIKQEMSQESQIEIPDMVREQYLRFRPTPLFRAYGLEKELATPAHIYYKYEGATLTGSHKINTALAQAYYNKMEGVEMLLPKQGLVNGARRLVLPVEYLD